jgi:hypothetical protein
MKVSASLLHRPYVTVRLVSMVDGKLFDKLAEIGSLIRQKPTPFGGIQVRIGLCTCYRSDQRELLGYHYRRFLSAAPC